MTKFISLVAAMVAAIGVTLATPASSDACHFGYGSGYGYGCGYNYGCGYGGNYCCSPVSYCYPANYCSYSQVVPYYRPVYSSVVVPGCSYCGYPQVMASAPVATNTFAVSSQAALDNTVQIHVVVPAGAKVWFNDAETHQAGTDRLFASPPLAAGSDYTYDVKARWLDQGGKEVTQVRQVRIRANMPVDVNFTQAAP